MKLPTLTGSSSLGSSPMEGLGKKDQGLAARPMHMLERKIAPHLMPGTKSMMGHGGHIKSLGASAVRSDAMMSPIPSGGLVGQ